MEKKKEKHNHLDQFYTQHNIASGCVEHLKFISGKLGIDVDDFWFVEPSAGCGCFYRLLPQGRRIGIDIDPRAIDSTDIDIVKEIIKGDYLNWSPESGYKKRKYIVIGNPPFGQRGKTAIDFFNNSIFADIIAFIVPVSFRKYFIHKKLDEDYKLVSCKQIARDSFFTKDSKSYSVNCEFQVWTRKESSLCNMREMSYPLIKHKDFIIRQYNNTKGSLKEFENHFDFAVPCQGYQDYTRRETKSHLCEKNKQWMLFTSHTHGANERLLNIDFRRLAFHCGTTTPGFRKNDIVRHYSSLSSQGDIEEKINIENTI